jgi:hypothetical protein
VNVASAAPPVFPDAIRTPADALAVLAAKKAIDTQKAAAMAVLMLLDPNVGQRLNVAA